MKLRLMPEGLNVPEKILYWTAQANAISLPFAALYAIGRESPEAAGVAVGNAVLMYGSALLLKRSYENRNGHDTMPIDWRPSIGGRYNLE